MTPLDPATELLRALAAAKSTADVLVTQLAALKSFPTNELGRFPHGGDSLSYIASMLGSFEQRAQAACPPVPVPEPLRPHWIETMLGMANANLHVLNEAKRRETR